MLEKLVIRNGSMTPAFNSEILEYNVEVNDAISLIMDYEISENATITVYGNDNLSGGENHVLVEIYDGSKVTTYTLNVNNNMTEAASAFNDTYEKVEVNPIKDFTYDAITPFISCICFLTIILLYIVLFRKK